jgi:hypothetical protein
MRKWLLGCTVCICILFVACLHFKSTNTTDLSETKIPSPSDSNLMNTFKSNEEWFEGLTNSDELGISTMEDGMQRMYKPTDRLFFNSSNVQFEFYYRHPKTLSLAEIRQLKNDITVKSKEGQTPIPFSIIAFEEPRKQGIAIQLNQAPQADVVVKFHSLDGLSTKEYTFEYMPFFTYQIHSPEDEEADYYAIHPGTYYRIATNRELTFHIHFSLDVKKEDVTNALEHQFDQLDWSLVRKSNQDLIISLRTYPRDLLKKFQIQFQGVKSTEGYVVTNSNVSLHGVVAEKQKYETIHTETGKVETLFEKMPRYQSLDVSSDGKFYLAKEEQDDFQGEFSKPNLTLLGANGDVIKHFGQALYPQWLADGQSFIYVSGDSIHRYFPATKRNSVIWTSPYANDLSIYYNFDGIELDTQSGRLVVSMYQHGAIMDIGKVDLYMFASVDDNSPRKVEHVSQRGNSSFTFQFDGTHIFYANNYVVADGSHWDNKLLLMDWKDLSITEFKGFTLIHGLQFLKDGEVIYQTGDMNSYEWYRYDFEKVQSEKLFTAEHAIDVAWWIGNGRYLMHDFNGTYTFSIQKPKFEKNMLLSKQAEVVGSSTNTIIYLQNPDPVE